MRFVFCGLLSLIIFLSGFLFFLYLIFATYQNAMLHNNSSKYLFLIGAFLVFNLTSYISWRILKRGEE